MLLRANLASLLIDENDVFTPVITLACVNINYYVKDSFPEAPLGASFDKIDSPCLNYYQDEFSISSDDGTMPKLL